MAYFVLTYTYADQAARTRTRDAHLEYLAGLHGRGEVVLAGPWADGVGAMVVYDVANEAAAREIVDNDPYTAAGVTGDPQLRPWTVAVPRSG